MDDREKLQLILLGMGIGRRFDEEFGMTPDQSGEYLEAMKAASQGDSDGVMEFLRLRMNVESKGSISESLKAKIDDLNFEEKWQKIKNTRRFHTAESLMEAMEELFRGKSTSSED